jgi:nucleotide-binding universal stress UspA family protein
MYERVVVTLDGSRLSEAVVPYAAAICAATGAQLRLLRVSFKEDAEEAESYLSRLSVLLDAEAVQVPAEGFPAREIGKEMAKYANGLLCMATHGRGGLIETILGSIASQVVHEAPIPVMLFRPETEEFEVTDHRPIKQVVATLDGSDYSERVLPSAAGLAQAIGAELTIVQVVSPDARAEGAPSGDVLESSYVRSRAGRMRDEYGLAPDWEVLHGGAADAIVDYVRGLDGAVLAMASHARTPLKKTVLGSVTSACLRHSGVPVLVVGPEFRVDAYAR